MRLILENLPDGYVTAEDIRKLLATNKEKNKKSPKDKRQAFYRKFDELYFPAILFFGAFFLLWIVNGLDKGTYSWWVGTQIHNDTAKSGDYVFDVCYYSVSYLLFYVGLYYYPYYILRIGLSLGEKEATPTNESRLSLLCIWLVISQLYFHISVIGIIWNCFGALGHSIWSTILYVIATGFLFFSIIQTFKKPNS